MAPKKKPVIRSRAELTDSSFIYVGKLENVCRKSLIVKITVDFVAKFGGILRLEDRKDVAKVHDTFGTVREYWVAAEVLESINITDNAVGTKFYMTCDHLVPLIKFFPIHMRHNFKYTLQEGDIQRRKRVKNKKYEPIPQRDVSGAGYDYVPSGSDGRSYVAEGPFCRTGLAKLQGAPIEYGTAPPNNAVKERITHGKPGRGTFVSTTLPPIGLNPQQPPEVQSTQDQQMQVGDSENKLKDITLKISGLNILGYYQDNAAAVPNPQHQLNTQPSPWRQYAPGYVHTPPWARSNTATAQNWRIQTPAYWQQRDDTDYEQRGNWRGQGRDQYGQQYNVSENSSVCNLEDSFSQFNLADQAGQYATRGSETNYGEYNRGIPAQEASTAYENYSMHDRSYGQFPAGYQVNNQVQYGSQRGRSNDQAAEQGGNRGRGYGLPSFRGRGRGGNQSYHNYRGGRGGHRGQQHDRI